MTSIGGSLHSRALCGDCPIPEELYELKARSSVDSKKLNDACASIRTNCHRLDDLIVRFAEFQIAFGNFVQRLEEATKKIERMSNGYTVRAEPQRRNSRKRKS